MRKIIFSILATLSLSGVIFSQCEQEPQTAPENRLLAEKKFRLEQTTELTANIAASTSNTSWQKKNAEAVALTIFVNGKYHQDLLLFAGTEKFKYEVFIGRLAQGQQHIEIFQNAKRSSVDGKKAIIHRLEIASDNSTEQLIDYYARANAPFIYARPNAIDKFSDIPLILYYEILTESTGHKKIRYSVIFSHEDGGTNSQGLMARWGRMTDIEWIYEISLNDKNEKTAEFFQGSNHLTTKFKGQRVFGNHPLIYTVTDNNNFSDSGCSALRFALKPVKADLSRSSRETLMEKFPWTYRVMAQEVFREERVNSNKMSGNVIGDPREYLFVEVYQELLNAAVSVSVKTDDRKSFTSDWGIAPFRVGRNGYVRIALFIPAEENRKLLNKLEINCFSVDKTNSGSCKNVNVEKIVRLDKNFAPIETKLSKKPQSVQSGQSAIFNFEMK